MSAREILLVDDSPDDTELFRIAAEQVGLGFPVRVADSGEAALMLILDRRVAPLLVLLDLKMPGIGGLEMLRRLRSHPEHAQTRVVVVSGSDLESDRRATAEFRCLDYITKPLSMTGYLDVARRVKELLAT